MLLSKKTPPPETGRLCLCVCVFAVVRYWIHLRWCIAVFTYNLTVGLGGVVPAFSRHAFDPSSHHPSASPLVSSPLLSLSSSLSFSTLAHPYFPFLLFSPVSSLLSDPTLPSFPIFSDPMVFVFLELTWAKYFDAYKQERKTLFKILFPSFIFPLGFFFPASLRPDLGNVTYSSCLQATHTPTYIHTRAVICNCTLYVCLWLAKLGCRGCYQGRTPLKHGQLQFLVFVRACMGVYVIAGTLLIICKPHQMPCRGP